MWRMGGRRLDERRRGGEEERRRQPAYDHLTAHKEGTAARRSEYMTWR